jgi:hypothetical protein
MDTDNPVVQLCAQGMQAEAEHHNDDARRLFMRAWEAATNDYDACVAAHYLARQQDNPQDTLRWNRESLARADAVGDERVREFYPSLFLNIGFSYEVIGDLTEARRYYDLAAGKTTDLPEGPYADMVREGVSNALKRTQADEPKLTGC